jgi:hypothetical protein
VEYIGWNVVKCFHTCTRVDWNLEVVSWNSKNVILQRCWAASLCEDFYVLSFKLLLSWIMISGGIHKREHLLLESQCNEKNLCHKGLLIYSGDLLKCGREYEYLPRLYCVYLFMKYLILYSRVFLEIHANHFYMNENPHCWVNLMCPIF